MRPKDLVGEHSTDHERSIAFSSGEGGPWDTVDEESRDERVGVVAENAIILNVEMLFLSRYALRPPTVILDDV